MKCQNCGGEIAFKKGFAVCINCGNKYEFEKAFETVDVFICYLETDTNGRRTRDSIVAQDIYYKLENTKISTFCEHVSASNLIDDNFEKAYYAAMHNAKVVIVLGTTRQYFDEVLQRNTKYFDGKKLLPIYSGMDATEIPEELGKLQALNYDSVGASSDLVNNILVQLGRKEEVDIICAGNKAKKRRRIVTISIVLVLLAFVVGVGSYYVFGTPYVLDENKYSYAQELIEQANYTEAMEILCELGEYKNSKNILSNVYAKYEGYYWDEQNNISLHVNISNDHRADIEVIGNMQDITLKITETSVIDVDKVTMDFIDSENNAGTLSLVLSKDAIVLHISTEVTNGVSFKDKKIEFWISEKSDKPIAKKVEVTTLLEWLDNKVTIGAITRMGFEIEHNGTLYETADGVDKAYAYKIKNTDITLAAFGYDLSRDNFYSEGVTDDFIIFAVTAPAGVLLPEKVGEEASPFVKNGYLYVPEAIFSSYQDVTLSIGQPWDFDIDSLLEEDTTVTMVSQKGVGNKLWNELLQHSVGEYFSKKVAAIEEMDHGGIYDSIYANPVSQSKDSYLIMVSRNILVGNLTERSVIAYYTANKENGDIKMILEYAIVTEYERRYVSYPGVDSNQDLFQDFMDGFE